MDKVSIGMSAADTKVGWAAITISLGRLFPVSNRTTTFSYSLIT